MTKRAKASPDTSSAPQLALRDQVVAHLATLPPPDRLALMVRAGVLTRRGRLTAAYRKRSSV